MAAVAGGLLVCASAGAAHQGEPLCQDPTTRPFLELTTDEGRIDVRLLEDAAPHAVRRLGRLVQGPLFHPELVPDSGSVGLLDGSTFDLTRPRLEVATSGRAPAELFEVPTEIDAVALGLDRELIATTAEAMDVMQLELLREHQRRKPGGGATGLLREWVDRFHASGSADFLVGTSRQRLNEALGYSYTPGLASRPAVRGAVALRPVATDRASLRLSILLADHPLLTGRWMVVGEVSHGLEVVDAISLKPLLAPPGYRTTSYVPRDPVTIRAAELVCRPTSGQTVLEAP
jgi:cyclophilin family peptidyl-prolyl cis-trans isomerase